MVQFSLDGVIKMKPEVKQAYNDHGQLIAEEYYFNGKLHRENGPAIRWWNNYGQLTYEEYWLYDKNISKNEFLVRCWDKVSIELFKLYLET